MVEMTPERIADCYELAKEFYENKISRAEAVAELFDKHKIPARSAGAYIYAFRYMMEGRNLNQSVNQGYVRYFFEKISHDKEQIKISLECLEKHIEYYARKKKGGGNVPGLRDIYNKYSGKVGSSKKL